ncbi:hypothetical protein EST38_g4005 [Candolleomyces aberdarensis]|uniref:Cytochrome P450 n=1 Tax=Candolleomyces aberdarensis TaxID=2316362 RepID=A0A4Q2DNN1_9AGAR|nr:hypothetical protein EST38_g4005 [Candolleomyces aberdarensis]
MSILTALQDPAISISLILVFSGLLSYRWSGSLRGKTKNLPADLGWASLTPILEYVNRREDFIRDGLQRTKESIWRFSFMSKTVIVLTGHAAREGFYKARSLDVKEGTFLLAFVPPIPGGAVDVSPADHSTILRRALAIQQPDNMQKVLLPQWIEDSCRLMREWGTSGRIDPCDEVYEVFFYLILRTLTCVEVMEDRETCEKLKKLYDEMAFPTNVEGIYFSWFPGYNNVKRLLSTKRVYDIYSKVIKERKASGVRKDDALQLLLDNGDDRTITMGLMMGMVMAGSNSVGRIGIWLVSFLTTSSEWRQKIVTEIKDLIESSTGDSLSPKIPLAKQLTKLSLDDWENKTPVLDLVVAEMLRLAQPHAAVRRNLGPDFYIDGKLIPEKSYLVYPFSDIHHNSEVYPDPLEFRPGREIPSNVPYAHLGWGAGKNPCTGRRLAKMQLKIIATIFSLAYDPSIVNAESSPMKLPNPDFNSVIGKPKEEFFIKYQPGEFTL